MNVLECERRTIPRDPDREAWLRQRAPFVGASEVAALFGEHPFLELGDLAGSKIDNRQQEQNAAMLRGIMLEDAVAKWWALEHGHELTEPTDLYVANECVIATLDREIHGERAALEVKTTAKMLSAPERYWYWQTQAQMACTGYERIELAVLDGTMSLSSYTIHANLEDQAELLKRAERFLTDVDAGIMPAGAIVSRDGIRRLYPDPTKETVELVPVVDAYGRTADPRLVLRDLKLAKARCKQAEHEVAKLEGILRTQLRDAATGTLDGRTVVTLRVEHYRELDVKRIREELPQLAEKYSRAATRRRMLLK